MTSPIFWLWVVLSCCGVAQWYGERLIAFLGVVGVCIGFTLLVRFPLEEEVYVGAKIGSRQYHVPMCVDVKSITDPRYFTSKLHAASCGYVAHRCVDVSENLEVASRNSSSE